MKAALKILLKNVNKQTLLAEGGEGSKTRALSEFVIVFSSRSR